MYSSASQSCVNRFYFNEKRGPICACILFKVPNPVGLFQPQISLYFLNNADLVENP